jgi:hypothetical protein
MGSLIEPEMHAALLRALLEEPGSVLPDSASWDRWVWTARLDGVVPLLYLLVDRVPTDLTDEQRGEARQIHGAVLARCVQLEHHAIEMSKALAARGIRCVLLKGGATAHLDYPNPSWREFSDIDLLIDPADRPGATSVIEAAEWEQGYALPRGHEQFTHAVTFVRSSMELDLHQRIAHRGLGLLIPVPELLRRATPMVIAGGEVLALDEDDREIHACIHAVASRGAARRLSSVADVLLMAHLRPHRADDVLRRAEGWRVRSLVERALTDASAIAQLELPVSWTEAMRRPSAVKQDRLIERAYLAPIRRPVVEELAHLRRLPWRDRWRYARGYFSVDPDYTAQHGRSGPIAQARYVFDKLRER